MKQQFSGINQLKFRFSRLRREIYQIFSNQTNLLQQVHFVYDASLWGTVLKVYLKDLNRFVRFDFPFGRRAKPSVTK